MKSLICLLILAFSTTSVYSQFIEDALRFSGTNNFISPRAAGLNVAYLGVADDVGALVTNPAGMTLIPRKEFSAGFGFNHTTNDLTVLNTNNIFKINNEFLSHIAFTVPIKTSNGIAAVGIGYFKEQDFRNSYEYSVYNNQSSIIANSAYNKEKWTYDLLLADANYNTEIKKDVQQKLWVDERGGMHNFTGGAAFDVNENVSLGFSLSGKWGSYDYIRDFQETDPLNMHNTWQVDDFNSLNVHEKVSQEISGITGMIGLQGRIEDFMRFGFSIKMPTWYEITEDFSRTIDVEFDPAPDTQKIDKFTDATDGTNSYNITTPFVYSAGFSFNAVGLTFAAGVEYTDVTQIEFSDATESVQDKLDLLNRIAIKNLVGQTTWGFGTEYKIPIAPIIVRASYAKTTSPYQLDVANANKSLISLGGSIYVGQGIRIDAVMRWVDVSEQRTAYGSAENIATFSNYIIKNQPLNIALGLTYRF